MFGDRKRRREFFDACMKHIGSKIDGTGKPETYTIKQLKKFNLDTKNYPEYVNKKVKILTFEEAVKEIKKNNLIVNVDGSKGNWYDEHFVNDIVNTLKQNSV